MRMILLDEALPHHRHRSRHCRPVPADPADAMRAAREVTVEEVHGLRLLLGLRALPRLLQGRSPVAAGGLVELGLRYGFGTLGDEPDELAVGLIGQPWRPGGGRIVRFAGPEGFRGFDQPGFVKVAAGFRAEAASVGSELCTETRVAATDDAAARRFARYWRVIGPFSGWLRGRMLAAIARRCRPH